MISDRSIAMLAGCASAVSVLVSIVRRAELFACCVIDPLPLWWRALGWGTLAATVGGRSGGNPL